jgi:hypothetical protein
MAGRHANKEHRACFCFDRPRATLPPESAPTGRAGERVENPILLIHRVLFLAKRGLEEASKGQMAHFSGRDA